MLPVAGDAYANWLQVLPCVMGNNTTYTEAKPDSRRGSTYMIKDSPAQGEFWVLEGKLQDSRSILDNYVFWTSGSSSVNEDYNPYVAQL